MWISFIEAVFLYFEIRVPIEKVYGLGLSLQKTNSFVGSGQVLIKIDISSVFTGFVTCISL